MKQERFDNLTVEQLVSLFADIALDQDKAMLNGNSARFNRLFDQMEKVKASLKARDTDQRRALQSLFDHRNAQVRFTAAVATMDVAPHAARGVFQLISDRDEYPQAANARIMLRELDQRTN